MEPQQFIAETKVGEAVTVLVDTWPDTASAEPRPQQAEAMHAWYPPGHSNITKGTSNTSCGLQLKRPPAGKPHCISLGSGEQMSAAHPTQELSTSTEGHWDAALVHRRAFKSC